MYAYLYSFDSQGGWKSLIYTMSCTLESDDILGSAAAYSIIMLFVLRSK